MPREFEIRKEVELPATPEQVWEAIATSEGNAAWFMPLPDVEPDGAGVTAWEPPNHLAVQVPAGADGSTQAFEYLIEARAGGSAVLRFVHSGFLSDDWHDEYEDMTGHGWDMYLHTLAEYFRHFPGRRATYVEAEGPRSSAERGTWPLLLAALGLAEAPAVGDRVRLAPEGVAPVDGVVDYVGPEFLGVRSATGLHRFHGRALLDLPVAVAQHLYTADVDTEQEVRVWQSWLHRIFP